MPPAGDVVNLVWEVCVVFVEQAVFAAIPCPFNNQSP